MNWLIYLFIGFILILGIIIIFRKKSGSNEDLIETLMVIDDSIIDEGDPYEIIDPVWWTGNLYDSHAVYVESLAQFSQEQRYVYAINWYISEVNNGGHDQFFFNSTGIVWKDALDGLEIIGAADFHAILQEAAKILGGKPSFDREERWKLMGDDSEGKFDDLDNRFYKIGTDLDSLLITYIKKNRQKFYFHGSIKKPKPNP